jgi:hypothetical protein
MPRFPVIFPFILVCGVPPALADELIRQANGQESLMLGLSYQHERLQSVDQARALVRNELAGPQIELGYANTRMRTFFGVPDIYTRVEISLALSQQDFSGDAVDPSTGVVGKSDGPFDVASESARVRVGYTREFGAGRHLALTPFLGLSQLAWLRGATSYSGTTAYYHYAAEIGLLGQATLTPKVVLGVDASLGHTVGAWQVDQRDLIGPRGGIMPSFALFLDNRTSSDWHQRLIVRQSYQHYGDPEQSVGSFQPLRHSALSVQLEFGTEGELFEYLFR